MVKCECIGAAWRGTCPFSGSTLRGLTRGLKGTQESAGLTAPRVVQTKVLLSNVSISVTSTLNPVCAVCLCSLGPWSTALSAVPWWASRLSAPPFHRATSG